MKSYAKVAVRSLVKQRLFTIINIVGLSIGMSIGLLALAAFVDVLETDRFHENGKNIYRVVTKVDDSNRKRTYANSSAPLSEIIKSEGSGVIEVIRLNDSFGAQVGTGTTSIPLKGYFSDQAFFRTFSFTLNEGDLNSALKKPFSMVITKETAQKLFYEKDPVGKVVTVEGMGEFQITGLLESHPRTHFLFDVLVSYNTLEIIRNQQEDQQSVVQVSDPWGPVTNDYSYLLVDEDVNLLSLDKLLQDVSHDQFGDQDHLKVQYGLQNLFDIPKTDYYNEIGLIWGYLTMTLFFSLSLLILIPACFNYTNISISRALKRTKEIGLRKVVGSRKSQIFSQFIIETLIISLISLIGGVYIFITVRSEFLSLIVEGRKTFDLELNTVTGLVFLVFALVTGMLAGLFPAVYFSKIKPIEALRKTSGYGKLSKINIRKSLVVAQFAISLVFILGVAIILKQYKYALNYDLGFDKENVLDVQLQGTNPSIFKSEFLKIAEVGDISMSSSIPAGWMSDFTYARKPDEVDSLEVSQMFIDQNFIENLDLEIIAGRNFPDVASNTEEYIIVNQQFLVSFGINDYSEALEQLFIVEDGKELRILGIVEDFNYVSIRNKIESFFFRYDPDRFRYANLKLQSNDITATIDKLDKSWKKIAEDKRFEARFLDDEIQDSLVSFVSMVKIFGFMGFLAITISCLGLLAMVVFTAENRTKEMGIRKVMGASIFNIAYTMAGSFVKLLGVSVLIAVPIAYFFFDKIFLRIHHYRTNIGVMEILVSVIVMFLLGLLTIGSQTFKTARANPVDSLKYE